jgi:ferredoxin
VEADMLADRAVRADLMAEDQRQPGASAARGRRRPMRRCRRRWRSGAPAGRRHYEPVWVESPECTACDECTTLAPKTFVYNDQKQAIVVNPKGAKYADLVKAAEKCTAGCLHPGTPWNMNEPGIEKLWRGRRSTTEGTGAGTDESLCSSRGS